MRVYLPTTLSGLADVVRERGFRASSLDAYAVTPALREWYVEGDLEELEYAAMTAAARRCLRLLADDPAVARRRVVVAADVADSTVEPTGDLGHDPACVRLTAAVQWLDIVSAHVDDLVAEADVGAAVRALPAADTGDHDAEFVVDAAEAHDLAWYAVQEIPDVVEG